ncbi:MAG TPA: 4-alpha-glucanotransferase, partial [Rhodospirillaceae bacterium]|nr:4-alpha-glucanotransferase [Rhodospirillaceae bacterium]
GAYVRYPVADLFRLVVLASARRRCLVIGEDLGTVPDGFRERMSEAGVLGYRLLVFEQDGQRFKAPGDLPEEALVTFGTHDLPSLAGWWAGIDIAQRRALALYPETAMADGEARERELARSRLVAALVAAGLLDRRFPTAGPLSTAQARRLARAVYGYLGRSKARLLMVQFEDLLGLSTQMNLPGTVDQHPNWRCRLPMPVEAMFDDPGLKAVVEDLNDR